MSDEKTLTTSSPAALRAIVIGILLALAVVAGFALHERSLAKRLAAQNDQISTALTETRGQIDSLNTKMNALAMPAPTAPPAPPSKPAAALHKTRRPLAHLQKDDPRWKKLQSQLDEQNQRIDEQVKQIDSTRQDLVNSHNELQGSIARTHDELVVLQRKGERNYYEFDLSKSKSFQHDGPVGIRLKKANTKHLYADLELIVDDANLSQKHVNLYQPVSFYASDNGRPVELVINKITNNHIHGYVSEPKYRQSELAVAGDPNTNQAAATASDAQVRQKLSLPK